VVLLLVSALKLHRYTTPRWSAEITDRTDLESGISAYWLYYTTALQE